MRVVLGFLDLAYGQTNAIEGVSVDEVEAICQLWRKYDVAELGDPLSRLFVKFGERRVDLLGVGELFEATDLQLAPCAFLCTWAFFLNASHSVRPRLDWKDVPHRVDRVPRPCITPRPSDPAHDLIIACSDGTERSAHKWVLAQASPVFEDHFRVAEGGHLKLGANGRYYVSWFLFDLGPVSILSLVID